MTIPSTAATDSDRPHEMLRQTTAYVQARIGKMFRQLWLDRLSELDLHIGQDIVLALLWADDGLMQAELAEKLHIQPATMTTILRRMCKAGLVKRRRDENDQRMWRIYPTAETAALHQPIVDLWQEMDDLMLHGFTLEERLLFRRFLVQMADNLAAATAEEDAQNRR